ncbi:MAG TPA: DUF1634 domain-containing protein [Candidatus Binataceae bacterium]|nr:DUF1634 domain-containing protein [Candidatus Binataceae bacterium]
MGKADEDRILRLWTPLLLRTILIVAMIVIVIGLVLAVTVTPGYYVNRYHAVQQGHLIGREKFAEMVTRSAAGDPHTVLMVGLFVLTLVPLARVAFCFVLFIRERDYTYVAFTAYVLAGLIVGIVLGGIG